MKSLLEMFPRASASTVAANPQLLGPNGGYGKQNDSMGILKPRRGVMNKVEKEFALILEAQKRAGEIFRYEFEGITLRWADMRYTPDFVVMRDVNMTPDADNWLVFIEVKGGWTKGKFERAVERFRHAKTYYGDVFAFELHQKTKNGWKRIY